VCPNPAGDAEWLSTATPVSHYFWILRRNRWKLLSFVAVCVASTIIVSQRLTPIYEATATVDIDRDTPTGVIGDERRNGSNDADQFLATQIALVQSDAVLRPVAERYRLRTSERDGDDGNPPDPVRAHEAPVVLKKLRVVRPPNTYLLRISYRSPDPQLAADVANGVAKSYLEQTYTIRFRSSASLSAFMEKQLDELKAKMERSSAALAKFERELNVINPEEKTSIASARLMQLNAEYTNAQADRVRKEAIYNLAKTGSPNALQISTHGEPLTKLQERLNEVEQKFAEIRSHYGQNHPEYKRVAGERDELRREMAQARQDISQRLYMDYQTACNRETILQKAIAETKLEFDRLNAHSFEYQSLKRESDADKQLYAELIRKIRESAINAGFQNSSIRIADAARPALKPVFPKTGMNTLLAFLLSSLIGIGAVVAADALSVTIRDPEEISKIVNTEVLGALPAVRSLRKSPPPASRLGSGDDVAGLVRWRGSVRRNLRMYEQAIETVRSNIMVADFEGRLKSLMITSACPFEGKSTIACHFALSSARNGQKTLLIDGDLRRPSVQRVLKFDNETGLADVLAQGTPWKRAVVPFDGVPNLDVLPAGSAAARAPELLGPRSLTVLIEEARKDYDLIVIDSPPVQGFPEPLRMAASVDGVVVVAQAGRTSRKALAATVSLMVRLRIHVLGVVLNQVKSDSGENGYYRYYHGYYASKVASNS
jgi:capsular exopolysaccharide synthesis family protein